MVFSNEVNLLLKATSYGLRCDCIGANLFYNCLRGRPSPIVQIFRQNNILAKYIYGYNRFYDFGKASDWKEIHNFDLATTCFNTAMEYFERIQRECTSPTETELGKRNAVIFSIYSMRAEMAMELQETEVTYNLVTRYFNCDKTFS